jgi:hypothetical protein
LKAYTPNSLSQEIVDIVEADTYWCLAKMLNAMEVIHVEIGLNKLIAILQTGTLSRDAIDDG